VECSLEQWEIYKLDPVYDCLARLPPTRSIISRASTTYDQNPTTPRHASPFPPNPFKRSRTRSFSPPNKRHASENDESKAESEVEPMVVDDPPLSEPYLPKRSQSAAPSTRPRTNFVRMETAKQRQARREKIVKATKKHGNWETLPKMYQMSARTILLFLRKSTAVPKVYLQSQQRSGQVWLNTIVIQVIDDGHQRQALPMIQNKRRVINDRGTFRPKISRD
jgi:hypothetical protein